MQRPACEEDFITERRVAKLRPNRVTVVPQACGMAGVLGALRPGCPRGRSAVCASASTNVSRHPRRSQGSNGSTHRPAHAAGRRLSHRGDHRESEAQSLRSYPWAAVRRAKARSYAAGPGFGGREPSRFLGTKRWKSQKLRQLSPGRTTEWKAFGGVSGQPSPNHSHRVSSRLAAL